MESGASNKLPASPVARLLFFRGTIPFLPLRSGPRAASKPSRQKKIPKSRSIEGLEVFKWDAYFFQPSIPYPVPCISESKSTKPFAVLR